MHPGGTPHFGDQNTAWPFSQLPSTLVPSIATSATPARLPALYQRRTLMRSGALASTTGTDMRMETDSVSLHVRRWLVATGWQLVGRWHSFDVRAHSLDS